jgi:predicted PurR-regulated permease PerM
VLSLIPVVGTTIIWIPAAAILALKGSYAAALFLGLWCLFWYFLLENLVKPVILGDRLNFHPLLFFFLLLGSIQTFGLAGVIAGPVLLTLFYSLWEIYQLLNEHNGSAGGGAAPRQGEAEHGSGGS